MGAATVPAAGLSDGLGDALAVGAGITSGTMAAAERHAAGLGAATAVGAFLSVQPVIWRHPAPVTPPRIVAAVGMASGRGAATAVGVADQTDIWVDYDNAFLLAAE